MKYCDVARSVLSFLYPWYGLVIILFQRMHGTRVCLSMTINFKIVEKFAYIVPSEVGSSTLLVGMFLDLTELTAFVFGWWDRKLSIPLYKTSICFTDINRIKRGKYSIRSKKRTGFKQAIDIYKGCFHFTNVYSYQRLFNMAKFC